MDEKLTIISAIYIALIGYLTTYLLQYNEEACKRGLKKSSNFYKIIIMFGALYTASIPSDFLLYGSLQWDFHITNLIVIIIVSVFFILTEIKELKKIKLILSPILILITILFTFNFPESNYISHNSIILITIIILLLTLILEFSINKYHDERQFCYDKAKKYFIIVKKYYNKKGELQKELKDFCKKLSEIIKK